VAAIRLQIASPVVKATCAVAADNAAMLRFGRRHLQPYLTGMRELRQARLEIVSEAPFRKNRQRDLPTHINQLIVVPFPIEYQLRFYRRIF